MEKLSRFVRKHIWPSIGMGIGVPWTLYGMLSGAYDLWTFGLPAAAWAAVGLLVFFLSVIAILVNWSADKDVVSLEEAGDENSNPNWQAALTQVVGRTYLNQVVELDGYAYHRCKFNHVTFRYGGGPVVLDGNEVGQHVVEPSTEETKRFSHLLVTLGHLRSQIMDERGRPITQEEWDRRHGHNRPDRH